MAKKIVFSDEAHFVLGGYVNMPNCHTWGTENPYVYIEKPTQPKRVTVWCRGIIGPLFFENEQLEAVTVNGDFYRVIFCSQKLKRRISAAFSFNRTALRATHPKLHLIFCSLFLKIALAAAKLMSFGHLGVPI